MSEVIIKEEINFEELIKGKCKLGDIQIKELDFETIDGLITAIITSCDTKDLKYVNIEITKRFKILETLTNIKFNDEILSETDEYKFGEFVLNIANSSIKVWDYCYRSFKKNNMYLLFEDILQKTIDYEINKFENKIGSVVDSLTDILKNFDGEKVKELLKDLNLDNPKGLIE